MRLSSNYKGHWYVSSTYSHEHADFASKNPLPGLLGELARTCFVEDEGRLKWAHAVVEGFVCSDYGSLSIVDKVAMFKSALNQCGAWCLFDL
jgi:hypothetical protein